MPIHFASLDYATHLVGIGDSVMVATGASDYQHGMFFLIYKSFPKAINNCGIVGATVLDMQSQITGAKLLAIDWVIMLVGYNDMRNGLLAATFQSRLQTAFNSIQTAGISSRAFIGNCLKLPHASAEWSAGKDTLADSYNAIISTQCTAYGLIYVDACAAWTTTNTNDNLHPNDTGHAQIANAFIALM